MFVPTAAGLSDRKSELCVVEDVKISRETVISLEFEV